MKEISENYKKVLQSLEALSDGEEMSSSNNRSNYASKKPKDLISSLLASKSNKIHIPKVNVKYQSKQKRINYFARRREDTDLSDLFLQITTKLENKENLASSVI